MRIISRTTLRKFWQKHSQAKSGLLLWYHRVAATNFQSFSHLRQIFPSADLVGNLTIFNIGGNNYRLIAYLDYKNKIVFIRSVLTHKEYDQDNWKNDDWF